MHLPDVAQVLQPLHVLLPAQLARVELADAVVDGLVLAVRDVVLGDDVALVALSRLVHLLARVAVLEVLAQHRGVLHAHAAVRALHRLALVRVVDVALQVVDAAEALSTLGGESVICYQFNQSKA